MLQNSHKYLSSPIHISTPDPGQGARLIHAKLRSLGLLSLGLLSLGCSPVIKTALLTPSRKERPIDQPGRCEGRCAGRLEPYEPEDRHQRRMTCEISTSHGMR